jgi:hypothetical protein
VSETRRHGAAPSTTRTACSVRELPARFLEVPGEGEVAVRSHVSDELAPCQPELLAHVVEDDPLHDPIEHEL